MHSMYFVKTPGILPLIYGNRIWKINTREKIIYPTFDDGPEEEITPKVLDILDKYGAKATFFCLGKNAEKHPGIIKDILSAGHALGNHSYSHKNGFKTGDTEYVEDVRKCEKIFRASLFRPPYGRMRNEQARILSEDYKIIMWDIIPGDFDGKVTKEQCFRRSVKYSGEGTVIVFHDSQKAKEKLLYTLPRYLEYYKEQGYSFNKIPSD